MHWPLVRLIRITGLNTGRSACTSADSVMTETLAAKAKAETARSGTPMVASHPTALLGFALPYVGQLRAEFHPSIIPPSDHRPLPRLAGSRVLQYHSNATIGSGARLATVSPGRYPLH